MKFYYLSAFVAMAKKEWRFNACQLMAISLYGISCVTRSAIQFGNSNKEIYAVNIMNWIIRSTEKLKFHTNLKELLKPIENEIGGFKWILTDLVFIMDQPLVFLSMEKDMCVLTSEQMGQVRKQHVQFVWGSIIAVPESTMIKLDELPFVEGNDDIWKNGNIQHEDGQIEIDCFDSSYTIVKFKDRKLSDTFKAYFDEAVELEKYK